MRLTPAPFEMIRSGEKTVELRLFDEKRRSIRIGDTVEFTNTENADMILRARVVDLHVFDSFKTLYASLPLLECGYTENDIETASPDDMNEYYSEEEQKKYGVIGIRIELI